MKLVSGQAQQVDSQRLYGEVKVTCRLHCIRMDQNRAPLFLGLFLYQPGYLRHRLHCADFVVGVHDADQHRLVRNRVENVPRVHKPGAIDGNVRDVTAHTF